MSESGSFHGGAVGDYKTFRQTSRDSQSLRLNSSSIILQFVVYCNNNCTMKYLRSTRVSFQIGIRPISWAEIEVLTDLCCIFLSDLIVFAVCEAIFTSSLLIFAIGA
ncbi:hypothetical protein MA16_Dca016115 [Dendrobium catenatum]|uniref:Uncharacterized protein n=1 Tax=Dendrobium catenatum TaxID=906689 RepID=A0A2I0WI38_9ASPA|nr:hypothetical protein MA16_Dca016115 [Dendrobium catenatum]